MATSTSGTASGAMQSGFVYAITALSGIGTSLNDGNSGTFNLYLGLSQGANNAYQGQSVGFAVTLDVTSDA